MDISPEQLERMEKELARRKESEKADEQDLVRLTVHRRRNTFDMLGTMAVRRNQLVPETQLTFYVEDYFEPVVATVEYVWLQTDGCDMPLRKNKVPQIIKALAVCVDDGLPLTVLSQVPQFEPPHLGDLNPFEMPSVALRVTNQRQVIHIGPAE